MARVLVTGMSGAGKSTLLAGHATVVVSGTVENQGRFYGSFDAVVLLSAPVDVLVERVRARTDNLYGQTPEQEAEIRGNVRDVEPLLRRGATVELDGRRPVEKLVADVERLLVRHPADAGRPWWTVSR
ncbi:ATP-binding protein [Kineosporia sp. R_H_3]|uniref:ATP-binding protein n=1 Tax=Kineosporia sp. R_H_3 TaxID=1961848 RepID=UPI000B4B0A65|nr:ATP-binding protein [Kineosporia sp. R_H_3]